MLNLAIKALAIGTYEVRIDLGAGTTNARIISLK